MPHGINYPHLCVIVHFFDSALENHQRVPRKQVCNMLRQHLGIDKRRARGTTVSWMLFCLQPETLTMERERGGGIVVATAHSPPGMRCILVL